MTSSPTPIEELHASRQETVECLVKAIEMHDVGKIATPEDILQKPGPLTPKERKQMERHTTVGHQILADSDSDLLRMAATIREGRGTQFDPQIVDALLGHLDEALRLRTAHP